MLRTKFDHVGFIIAKYVSLPRTHNCSTRIFDQTGQMTACAAKELESINPISVEKGS